MAFRTAWARQQGAGPIRGLCRGTDTQQRIFDLIGNLAFGNHPELGGPALETHAVHRLPRRARPRRDKHAIRLVVGSVSGRVVGRSGHRDRMTLPSSLRRRRPMTPCAKCGSGKGWMLIEEACLR